MRALLTSSAVVALLAGCAAVPGPYGYGDAYYYEPGPAYYGYYDYGPYYGPGYYGGVIVRPPVVVGSARPHSSEPRSASARPSASANGRGRALAQHAAPNATKQSSAERRRRHLAGAATNDRGS